MQCSFFVAISCDLLCAVTQSRAFAVLDFVSRWLVAGRDIIAKLRCDVGVFGNVIGNDLRLKCFAAWIVKFRPRIFATGDKIDNQQAGDSSVGHAVARKTGRHIHILVAWIAADVSDAVHRFHHLSGPTICDFADKWKAIARPMFELGQTLFEIRCLPAFVILTADHENVALFVTCKTNVMIRNRTDHLLFVFGGQRRVPKQRVIDFVGYAQTNYITRIRRLLRMNHQPIIDRAIRGHHGRLRGNDVAV